jgi:MFS family permease
MSATRNTTNTSASDIEPDNAQDDPEDQSAPASGGLAALKHRNYRLFFSGQLVSVTGMWMQSLAQSWLLVDTLKASPFQLGLLPVFQFGPVLLLGIPAGIIADRVPKRNLMIVTQVLFSVLAAVLAWLVWHGGIQLWHVYLIATLFGLNNAVDMPARQAFISELVPRDALMNAIALNSAMFNTGRILGPAVAGVVLAKYGIAACFALNALSYGGVITGLAMMDIKHVVVKATGSGVERLKQGISFVRNSPDIMRPIILVMTVGTFGMAYNTWLPLIADGSFNAGEQTFGLLFSSMGAGSLAGALSVAFFSKRPSRSRMLLFAIMLGIVIFSMGVVAAIPLSVQLAMVVLALSGFSASNAMAMANTIVQTTAPDELRGRVMAVYSTVFMGSAPLGGLIAGSISNRWGVEMSMYIGGMIVAVVATMLYLLQRDKAPQQAEAPLAQSGH